MEDNKSLYNKLNTSQDLDYVFNRFSKYRKVVTRIIVERLNLRKEQRLNIVVFGAGNLMDIDYNQLKSMSNCHELMLTDIDHEAMTRGIEYLNLDHCDIRTASFNYIGEFVEGYLNLLINQLNLPMISKEESIEKVEAFFESVIREFQRSSYLDHITIKGDIVVVMPIYTQLLYIEIEAKLQGTNGYPYIQSLLLQKMIYVIDEFNKKLLNCLNKDGDLIVFSDIIEEKISDDSINESEDEIKDKIQAYEKTYGVGLGSFGLLNISEYAIPLSEYYINWDFSEKRKFLVKGLLLENLNNQ